MTATTVPLAAAVAAGKLVATHQCVVCRDLPERPFDKADEIPGQDYRPRKPAKIVSGKTARSFRCLRHTRAKKRADSFGQRTADKATRYGVPRELQVALWVFQGCACPCGRKASPTIPPGVTLDHDHSKECVGPDHPANRGCRWCVTGFVCSYCNLKILGFLEGCFQKLDDPRAGVVAALAGLHAHVTDPPLARLLAERPELLETAA